MQISPILFPVLTNLVALACRSTGFAGIWAHCGMRDEVRVTWTLCALAAVHVYVVPSWAWHTRGAGGLRTEGTSPAPRGHPINSIAYSDGVDTRHVVDPPT